VPLSDGDDWPGRTASRWPCFEVVRRGDTTGVGSELEDDGSANPAPGKGAPPRRDRYGSLMESLRAGDAGAEGATNRPAAPPPPHRGVAATWRGWHPVAQTFLVVTIAVALGYVALLFTNEFLRGSRVDTWAGPDASSSPALRWPRVRRRRGSATRCSRPDPVSRRGLHRDRKGRSHRPRLAVRSDSLC